jgi:hypothetical protein
MAINEPASLTVQDALRDLAQRLDTAAHGECTAMIRAFGELYDWSYSRVYRALGSVGWTSGRKPRADRGTTSQDMDVLTDVCATLRIGQRKNGKATMHTPTAVSLLSQNGREFTVTNSRVNALLKVNQMNMASQRLDRAAQSMRSLHPNHVHQVDPSLCLIYYMPDGKQRMIQEDEFYKNKLENVAKLKLKVWRYVLTDHFSNTTIVRYYQAKGETQANLFDFLLYCWNKQEGRVIHGVPKMLYWDKGSANTAGAIKNALIALQVKAEEHKAKNPRAKGSVENGNNRVECLFESRLMYEPVENVDQLNAAAEGWYNAYNADAIPNYDARLHRKYMAEPQARYALWQMIRREQLRILPAVEMCRLLLSADPIERKVDGELVISFKHPSIKQRLHYDVGHIPGVFIGAMVKVSPLVYGENQVLVTVKDYKNEETTHIVSPVAADAGGFRADGAVYGEEYKSRPDTVIETAGKAADQAAYAGLTLEEIEKAKNKNAVPFGGLDAHSYLKDVAAPSFMDRPGERLNVPSPIHIEIKPLTQTQAAMRLRSMLGRPVAAEDRARLAEWYPQGVMEEQLQEVADRLEGKFATPALRLVAS